MNPPPPQAIAPLKERLFHLRQELSRLHNEPFRGFPESTAVAEAIQEMEALIKRLENPNVSSPA